MVSNSAFKKDYGTIYRWCISNRRTCQEISPERVFSSMTVLSRNHDPVCSIADFSALREKVIATAKTLKDFEVDEGDYEGEKPSPS